jgi:hypothetical protein
LLNQTKGTVLGVFGNAKNWDIATVRENHFLPTNSRPSSSRSQFVLSASRTSTSVMNPLMLTDSMEKNVMLKTKRFGDGTWFSNSYYAKSRFTKKHHRLPCLKLTTGYHNSGFLRVFTHLEPQELDEIGREKNHNKDRKSANHEKKYTI